jgi:hypothetical protein
MDENKKENIVKKKSKNWLNYAIFILLLVALGTVVYLLFGDNIFKDNGINSSLNNVEQDNSQQNDTSPEIVEDETKYEKYDVSIDLGDGKELIINNPPIVFSEEGYILVSDVKGKKIFRDNAKGYESTVNYITYYEDKEELFGDGSLGSIELEEGTYQYVSKEYSEQEGDQGIGVVYNEEDRLEIDNLKAYQFISYQIPPFTPPADDEMNTPADFGGLDDSSGINISCVFDLSEISSEIKGALQFWVVSASEQVNACDSLDDDFTIEVRDRELSSIQRCWALEDGYEYKGELGEINEEYIGSWDSCPNGTDRECNRILMYPNGNYILFTSDGREQGIWGRKMIEDSPYNVLYFAKDGEVENMRDMGMDQVQIRYGSDNSSFRFFVEVGGVKYWKVSYSPDMWNPKNGRSCF